MKTLVAGAAIGSLLSLLGRGVLVQRGAGSWGTPWDGSASFQVETVEVQYGPWYAEFVWGRWA